MTQRLHVIGGGLAGSEAAWQAARRGMPVTIHEMRPNAPTPAHKSGLLAELVCSNSLKSEELTTGSGLLKAEARELGSLLLDTADEVRVPAGTALTVDRAQFAERVTDRLTSCEGVTVVREEVTAVPEEPVVVLASGPLTGDRLAASLAEFVGRENLFFFDALAPIVDAESVDMNVAFRGSRYGKGEGEFLNCPFSEEQYRAFWEALVGAKVVEVSDVDKRCFFEGCLPLEEIAGRGYETIAFGPLRPVGLADPRGGRRPFAVLQLRPENRSGTMFGLVGCQTRLTRAEQRRVFRMVPGLERARFLRYGEIHRNTYIESPSVLTSGLMAGGRPGLFMAGQIVGGEGYAEAIATGLLAGTNASRFVHGLAPLVPPEDTALGALVRYISEGGGGHFSPMNFNFGLLPALRARGSARKRKEMKARRAMQSLRRWKEANWNEA